MKVSKTAIAVAISSAFLFGCDFDVGSENNTSGGGNDGTGGGGLPPVENAQNYVQIQDSSVADTGILRLKTSESKSDTVVDNIPVGFLTVDLTYQDNAAINGENAAANAYIQIHTTAGSSNAHLRGEIALGEGKVKYRDNSSSLVETGGTYTPGEELKVKVSWTEDEFSFSIGDDNYGPYAATNTSPVELISLKVGDSKTKADLELIADNLKIYSGTEAENELIFEDDFDNYGVGDDLTASRYNRAIDVMVLGTGEDNGGDDNEGDNGGDEPVVGDTISKLNERIRALPAAEDYQGQVGTVTVYADGNYKNGTIVIDRPVNLVGENGAVIDSSCTVVQRYATLDDGSQNPDASQKMKDVSISNITFTGAAAEACSVNESGSTARTAIYLAGDTGGQINFSNLTFEADSDGNVPSHTWFYARGQFELKDSVFTGMDDSAGIQINAGSSAGRKGSLIHGNTFVPAAALTGSAVTSGIQIGHKVTDSGDALDVSHKDGANAYNAGVYVYDNEFTGFTGQISADLSAESYLDVAVFANDANDTPLLSDPATNIISNEAIDADGQNLTYNTFN